MPFSLDDDAGFAFEVTRLIWCVAGPYTFLLGFGALVFGTLAIIEGGGSVVWTGIAVFCGVLIGWVTDLLSLLICRPLAKLAGFRPQTWIGDLLLGLPIAVLGLLIIASQGWIQ